MLLQREVNTDQSCQLGLQDWKREAKSYFPLFFLLNNVQGFLAFSSVKDKLSE